MRCCLLASLIGTFWVLVPAVEGAPVPKDLKQPKYYAPVVVGTKWVMKTDGKERTCVIHRVEKLADKLSVHVGVDIGLGVSFSGWTEHVSENGVFRLFESTTEGPNGLLPLIKVPTPRGGTWESTITTDGVNRKWEKTVVGQETVTVPAGKFEAVRIDWVSYDSGKKRSTGSDWYALGVGLVKKKSVTDMGRGAEHISLSEMQSFTPPGAAKRDK